MSTWTTKGCCQSLIRTTLDDEDVLTQHKSIAKRRQGKTRIHSYNAFIGSYHPIDFQLINVQIMI